MGKDVISLAQKFLNEGWSIEEINQTFIVLILKLKKVVKITILGP